MAIRSNRFIAGITLRRIVKWSALATLLVVAGTIVLLHTAPVQQFLLRRAEDMARAAGYPFSAKSVRIRPFDLEASLSGFLYDNKGVRVEVDRLDVDVPWNIYNFSANGIVLNSIVADGLRITIKSPEPVLPEPSGETAAIPRMVADRLVIRNGRFSYENQSSRVDVPSFEIETAHGKGTLKLDAPVTISPDTSLRIPEIALELSPDRLLFGPIQWAANYGMHIGSGSAGGTLRWSPSIAATVTFETQPMTIERWDRVVAMGIVRYEDGVLNLEGFRATRDMEEILGTAKITDQNKSANLQWSGVRIDPSGIRGETRGRMNLQWQASDFSDIKGNGSATVVTRDYGRADSDLQLAGNRLRLNVRAASMGADIRANITTGFDRKLSGTFRATYPKYGLMTAQGRLGGTLSSPVVEATLSAEGVTYNGIGPLRGAANASYRQNALNVRDMMISLKRSSIPNGSLKVDLKTRAIDGALPEISAELGDFLTDGAGHLQGSALISGSLDHPAATFSVSSGGLDIGGTHIDRAESEAMLAGNLLTVTRLVALQKEGSLEASGVVNLETERAEGKAKVSNLQITDIRDFSAIVNMDADIAGSYREPSATVKGELIDVIYAGQEHGSVGFSGTANRQTAEFRLQSAKYSATAEGAVDLKTPYAFSATVDARQSPVSYQQYEFVLNGRAHAVGDLTPSTLTALQLEGFALTGEGVDLKASGSLDAGVKVDLAADLARLPVENIDLTGTAQVSAIVHGPLDNPEITGDLQTTDATFKTLAMPQPATLEAAVNFDRDRFTIRTMHAEYADARAMIEGSGTLAGTGEFTFLAENIRPEQFLADRPLSGLIGLEGRIRLNAPRLDAVEGQATVTQLELNARGVEVHQTQQGEIKFENQIVSVRNFNLEGPETKAAAGGEVNLATGDINLDVEADTDLRILEGFVPRTTAFGRIESRVAVRGKTAQPEMKGFVNLDDAQIQIDEPGLLLSEVHARLELSGNRIQIQSAKGNLNGGEFDVTGGTGLSSAGLQNTGLQFHLKDTTLEYPEGLQSGVSAEVSLDGTSPNLILAGDVTILDALYREDIDLSQQVFAQLTPRADDEPDTAPMLGFAGEINLDVNVDTSGPVTIANNVAKMDMYGTFRVLGTISEPIILGRADAIEGGEVYFGVSSGGEASALGERRDRYVIERGTVEFNNPLRTEPTIDFEATHDLKVKGEQYAIRLKATGTPTDLRTELTSDPVEQEADIIAMLLTGRTRTDLQGTSNQVAAAREQLLGYVSGQLSTRFFQNAGAVLGLDSVTLEPSDSASEDDVSARLTVGKDISRDLSLIYAQNLAGPRNQSWIVNYSTFRNFVIRGINRPDEDMLRMELRHGLEFGGGPPLPRRVAPSSETRLNNVTFSQTTLSAVQLRKQVAKKGSPYSVNRMSDDVRSLHEFLASEGYVDAKIRTSREASLGQVDVHFTIDQGPKVAFEYSVNSGEKLPDSVQKEVRQIWIDGRAEAPTLKASIEYLLRYFRDKGYLECQVSGGNEAQNPDERSFVFRIDTGRKFKDPKWVFNGVEAVPVTSRAGVVMQDPEGVRKQIEAELRARGFLDAKATIPQLVKDPEPLFVVTVDPGPQYLVTALNHTGNSFFKDSHLTQVVILGPTQIVPADDSGGARPPDSEKPLDPFPYTSDWVSIARRRIMTEYWQEGFNDVRIAASTTYVPASGRIEVSFDINEGEQQKIRSIRITGDDKTLRSHVQRYLRIFEGDPVDYSRISLTRKRLYDTGLFKRVDIEMVKEDQGNVAEITLNERAPWSVKYGFTVSDHREQGERDRDIGFSTELTYRNLFGRGISAGLTTKLDASFREARLYTSFPVFLNRDVATTVSLFRTRETLPDLVSNTLGFTLKQQWRLHDFYLLSYDYAYRRVSTAEIDTIVDDPEILNEVVPVARLNATLTRDTRDDIFNATRGTFLSNSFDFAPPGIGSSIKYIRNYAQYLRFREIRPRLIWASAYRLGIARGLGGSNLVPIDQFTAGGSSLRAFTQDNSALSSGNALFVTNQELRFPLFWRVGAAGFFDIGNVYERIGTANLLRQRYSPGFGLRVDTPFLMFRVDMGLNLWPRTGEDHRRISFGIGQAF